MSLVAYGSSDESDSDDASIDIPTTSSNVKIVNGNESISSKVAKPSESAKSVSHTPNSDESNELFHSLPAPQKTFSMPDNTFKLLSKKQPVKIILPSLSDIKSDDDEVKKPKPSTKGSGLFALLPAPKNSSSTLMPDSVKNRNIPKPVSKPLVPDSVRKPKPVVKKAVIFNEDDDDMHFDGSSFFFNPVDDVKPEEMEPVNLPDLSSKTLETVKPAEVALPEPDVFPMSSQDYTSDQNQMETDINDEAIEKLCGAGAKKRKAVPDEIIDINVGSMVGDAYMWLSKDLTKEQEHSSFKKQKNLSTVERRKHQITYLASQAKEKEMELRNQWANSRMTRKQTQSKYGF